MSEKPNWDELKGLFEEIFNERRNNGPDMTINVSPDAVPHLMSLVEEGLLERSEDGVFRFKDVFRCSQCEQITPYSDRHTAVSGDRVFGKCAHLQ